MRTTLILAAALSMFASPSQAAVKSPLTAEDLVRLDRVSDPQASADGRYVAFTVRETDMDANKGRTDLWLLDLDADEPQPRRLTQHEANDSKPRWSADGASLFFLSTRSGTSQVWRLALAGGEAMQVTRFPVDVNELKVAPKGTRLLISMEVFPDCTDLECTSKRLEANDKSPAKGQVHDRLFVRHWDTWKDGRIAQLFSVALDGTGNVVGAPVSLSGRLDADVPSKPMGGDEEFNFSPDGTRVVFAARVKGKEEPWSTNFDVYETAADGSGEPRNLTADNPAWDTQPVYSSDGHWLAWLAMERPKFEADRFQLVLKDLKSGETRRLTQAWDRSIDHFDFSPDARRIFATTDHLGQHALWSIDTRSGKPTLRQPTGQVTEFSVGPQQVVMALANLGAPADLYGLNLSGGQPHRLTHFNAARLGERSLGAFEQFTFAGWNGETVHGYVDEAGRVPRGRHVPGRFPRARRSAGELWQTPGAIAGIRRCTRGQVTASCSSTFTARPAMDRRSPIRSVAIGAGSRWKTCARDSPPRSRNTRGSMASARARSEPLTAVT